MKSHVLTLIAIAILSLSGCTSPPTQDGRDSFSSLLKSYSFEELGPPSRIPSPGTVIRVNSIQPLNYNVVCSANEAFGNEWAAKIISSDTTDINVHALTDRKFSVGVSYLSLLSASASAGKVSDIKMQLSNAKLLLITSASARSGMAEKNCLFALNFKEQRLAGEITMVTSALQADVEYSVEFKQDASLTLDAKMELLRNIAGKLGGTLANDSSGTVRGTNLFWGIKRDRVVFQQYLDAHQ